MRSSPPTRLPEDVYALVAAEAERTRRSLPQQIAHWALLGRELEASPGMSGRDIADVLRGDGSYDRLGERAQAIVRAEWQSRVDRAVDELDLAAEFRAAGRTWTEADEDGNLITRYPDETGAAAS